MLANEITALVILAHNVVTFWFRYVCFCAHDLCSDIFIKWWNLSEVKLWPNSLMDWQQIYWSCRELKAGLWCGDHSTTLQVKIASYNCRMGIYFNNFMKLFIFYDKWIADKWLGYYSWMWEHDYQPQLKRKSTYKFRNRTKSKIQKGDSKVVNWRCKIKYMDKIKLH